MENENVFGLFNILAERGDTLAPSTNQWQSGGLIFACRLFRPLFSVLAPVRPRLATAGAGISSCLRAPHYRWQTELAGLVSRLPALVSSCLRAPHYRRQTELAGAAEEPAWINSTRRPPVTRPPLGPRSCHSCRGELSQPASPLEGLDRADEVKKDQITKRPSREI